VAAALLRGPRANGFPTDLWTLGRVADVIETTTGVRYSQTQTWEILRQRLGWTRQRPARRALERDDENIARWVKEQWPRIRAGPGGAGRGSSSKTSRESPSSRR
jgi:transposase